MNVALAQLDQEIGGRAGAPFPHSRLQNCIVDVPRGMSDGVHPRLLLNFQRLSDALLTQRVTLGGFTTVTAGGGTISGTACVTSAATMYTVTVTDAVIRPRPPTFRCRSILP
jgi:hypothetical protein